MTSRYQANVDKWKSVTDRLARLGGTSKLSGLWLNSNLLICMKVLTREADKGNSRWAINYKVHDTFCWLQDHDWLCVVKLPDDTVWEFKRDRLNDDFARAGGEQAFYMFSV